jgi:MFS family permease
MMTVGVLMGEAGAPLLIIAGIGVAPVFPTVMAVLAKLFADDIDLAMTATMTTMGIFVAPANILLGAIVHQARILFTQTHGDAGVGMGYAAGYMFLALSCFGALASTLLLRARQKKAGQLV